MSTETASWFIVMFYFLTYGVMSVSVMYFMYWLAIELPVLLRIKRERLYNRWRD